MVDLLLPEDSAWGAFVDAHPEATCFHRPEWSRLLAESYGYPGFVVVDRAPDGRIVGGLPLLEVRQLSLRRRWVCLPFSDECGPLLAAEGSAERLLAGVDDLRRRVKVDQVEVRVDLSGTGWAAGPVGVVHTQPLEQDVDRALADFSGSGRRHLRKAQRSGVVVRQGSGVEDIKRFYALHVATRRRKGVPVQPRRYFRLLWEIMIAGGHGALLLAEHDGTLVAGAVYLVGGRTATYKYGASDPAHWGLYPNNLLMWHAMRWAVERECSTFDWGRSDPHDDGLRRFKASLGGRERTLVYTRQPGAELAGSGGAASLLMGPLLRRLPPWACQATGELLYRYAG